MQFFQTPNIDFANKRRIPYAISAALFLLGMVSIFLHGGLNLGIDFKGGTEIVFKFDQDVTVDQLRGAMSDAGMGGSQIRHFGGSGEYVIYVGQQKEGSVTEIEAQVKKAISDAMPDVDYTVRKADNVGPKVGQQLRKSAMMAIGIALLLILVYIGWRFEFIFALGAIAALFHDVLITLGFFSIVGFELSLSEIAAFLTIVGYSLNDTIVVYDRIRENLKVLRNEELETIVNKSINQVLSRTVVTSLTTFIVVLVLFLFGGEVIKGFAFTMMVGVVIGTYSSIFVASALVLEWQTKHGGKRSLKMSKKKR
ncbi:protein translocase subunit SecF [bacterium]|nr:protein translocase subunit SecF [bacterium]